MGTYAFFNNSGEIETVMNLPSKEMADAQQGVYLECEDGVEDTTHYVSKGKVLRKKAIISPYNISGLIVVFPSLPIGTKVSVNNMEIISDEEPTEIEFDISGNYIIRLSGLVEYVDKELEVAVG